LVDGDTDGVATLHSNAEAILRMMYVQLLSTVDCRIKDTPPGISRPTAARYISGPRSFVPTVHPLSMGFATLSSSWTLLCQN